MTGYWWPATPPRWQPPDQLVDFLGPVPSGVRRVRQHDPDQRASPRRVDPFDVVACGLGHVAQTAADLAGGRRGGRAAPAPPQHGRSARRAGAPPHNGDGGVSLAAGLPGWNHASLAHNKPCVPAEARVHYRGRFGPRSAAHRVARVPASTRESRFLPPVRSWVRAPPAPPLSRPGWAVPPGRPSACSSPRLISNVRAHAAGSPWRPSTAARGEFHHRVGVGELPRCEILARLGVLVVVVGDVVGRQFRTRERHR